MIYVVLENRYRGDALLSVGVVGVASTARSARDLALLSAEEVASCFPFCETREEPCCVELRAGGDVYRTCWVLGGELSNT